MQEIQITREEEIIPGRGVQVIYFRGKTCWGNANIKGAGWEVFVGIDGREDLAEYMIGHKPTVEDLQEIVQAECEDDWK